MNNEIFAYGQVEISTCPLAQPKYIAFNIDNSHLNRTEGLVCHCAQI